MEKIGIIRAKREFMDYRERKYYLVRFNDGSGCIGMWWSKNHDNNGKRYSTYCNLLKRKIPSIKVHAPYNHFKSNPDKYGYDGCMDDIGFVQLMISCRKEEIDKFKMLLSEIKEKDDYVVVKEITKRECEQ